YFRTLVLKKPTLRVCEFSITPQCQSKCNFCYAAKFEKPGDTLLSSKEIIGIWNQAKQLGAFSSIVFGGEPLLHPHFFEIIEALEPKRNLVTITTNGISLSEEKVIRLKRLGVFLVNISLNSLNPELNDRLRGYRGHFDAATKAIELCKKHGIDVFL